MVGRAAAEVAFTGAELTSRSDVRPLTVAVKVASTPGAFRRAGPTLTRVIALLPRRSPEPAPIVPRPRGLTVSTGLAGLSLDAMASVAYGPEAIVLVLATAGGLGLGMTLPVTLAIAALLAVLVASYRQVIAAFPNGGGAYAAAQRYLGHRTGLLAAASLIVDYVLNVAVSLAAGVAALTSAFPALHGYTVGVCLAVLVGITALNLLGITESARAFMVPTAVFVAGIFVVIIGGLLRSEPAAVTTGTAAVSDIHTVGVLLLLKAFASGCAALTGVEAIANAVPSFREPRVRRAQRAEVALGLLLGTMLIGLAVLIEKFSLRPIEGTTVLSQLTEAALGHGVGYYVVQFATVLLLALAANTSYGGLPTLTRLLADDNCLPHRFAVATPRQVYRYGVLTLGASAAVLLVAAGGRMNALVPLFAIGVFVGFTIAQTGMVRHWWRTRSDEVCGLSREALSAAMSIGDDVTAVHVCLPGESTAAFTTAWEAWHPEVRLVLLADGDATVGGPVAAYVREHFAGRRKVVVIAEVDPPAGWERVLPSHRSDELERVLRKMTDTVVCHLRVQVS